MKNLSESYRNKVKYFIIFCLIVSSFIESIVPSALASPKDDLAQTQKDMEDAKTRQLALAEQSRKVDAELNDLKEKLVRAAESIEKGEADLSASEEKLRILDEQLHVKDLSLKTRRKELVSLLQAALALSRTPPEAMIMMPGDSMENMQAARALKMVSESIKQESESITGQIGELQELKDKVTKGHEELTRKQTALSEERRTLEHQLVQRSALQAKLGHEQQEETQKLTQLAKKAEDLQELMGSLQKEETQNRHAMELTSNEDGPRGTHGKLRSFAAATGHIRPPAPGHVVQLFGSGRGHNETSKGIVIVTRSHTQVVAPYDGEVVYAGTFLNYGQMVIIRHSDDFHTLLAGLAKIDVDTGEFLLEGEPIGAMGEGETGNRLYVELRKNNQPVDPAPWIIGLNQNH